jgi:hypothetical protein
MAQKLELAAQLGIGSQQLIDGLAFRWVECSEQISDELVLHRGTPKRPIVSILR